MGKLFDRLRASKGRSNLYIDNDRLSETANYADQRLRNAWTNMSPEDKKRLYGWSGLNSLEDLDRGPDGKYHWKCKANCEE